MRAKGNHLRRCGIWICAIILVIASFGFYLRCLVVYDTEVDHPIRADAAEYYLTAYNLAKNGVYTMSDARLRNPGAALQPDNFRWPGLPLLIAAFMAHWPDHHLILREVQWVNIVAGTATLMLIGAAAATVFPAWAAISVVSLATISPHLLSLTVYMLTETPAAFFVALLLGLCAVGRWDDTATRPSVMVALGMTVGVLALFRPLFVGFLPLLALAVTRSRLKCLILVLVGAAVPLAPWLIRNMLVDVSATTPSSLAMTMVTGAYPDYMFNGDPRTFPFPQSYDPNFLKVSANATTATYEILRRIAADPWGMTAWYFLRKPVYLWQFVNIDGVGDVFVYPIRTSPFTSNPVFVFTHDVMQIMHWPIVVLGAIGSILVWRPDISTLLPESRGLVLRTASLLLIFLTVATFPLNNPVRFAVPVFPALFLMAMVPPLTLVRWIGRKSERRRPNSAGR